VQQLPADDVIGPVDAMLLVLGTGTDVGEDWQLDSEPDEALACVLIDARVDTNVLVIGTVAGLVRIAPILSLKSWMQGMSRQLRRKPSPKVL
jgi:hypothetical protein